MAEEVIATLVELCPGQSDEFYKTIAERSNNNKDVAINLMFESLDGNDNNNFDMNDGYYEAGSGMNIDPSTTWSCDQCTFAQSIDNIQCEVCGAQNLKALQSAISKEVEESEKEMDQPPQNPTQTTDEGVPPVDQNLPYKKITIPNEEIVPEDRQASYSKLKSFILSPNACTDSLTKDSSTMETDSTNNNTTTTTPLYTDVQLRQFLQTHSPNINSILDRTQQNPVTDLICLTYRNGLPIYATVPSVQLHIIHAIRSIFAKLFTMPPNLAKKYIDRLTDCFKACMAEQGRVIDSIYGTLSGRDKSFKQQILAIIDTYKENIFDQTTNYVNPDSWKIGDISPLQQIPHLQSAYRVAVGKELGLRGVKAASADKNRRAVGVEEREIVKKVYERLFSVKDLIETVMKDVNQQEEKNKDKVERLVDVESLAKWAGNKEENGGFDGHSIYYDEEKKKDYGEMKPLEENVYKPFLSHTVTMNVLLCLFCTVDATQK